MAMVQGVGQVLPIDVRASRPDGFDSILSAVVVAFECVEAATGRESKAAHHQGKSPIMVRREIDMVAAWSVDRLGRSLQDLVSFLAELHAGRCELYLHQQVLDTSTPAGRALFGMLSVFADSALQSLSNPGRPCRPFAPLIPSSLNVATTSHPWRRAASISSRSWLVTVCRPSTPADTAQLAWCAPSTNVRFL